MRTILRFFRVATEAIQRLVETHEMIAEASVQVAGREQADGHLDDALADLDRRLDSIERNRAIWEGEMEAAMVKVDSKFRAARAAEERERHLRKSNEETDESDDEGMEGLPDEYIRAIQGLHADAGEGEGVPALYQDVGAAGANGALSGRELARRKKWGMI